MERGLLEVKNQPVGLEHFPTRLQLFIWRNWGIVSVNRISEVIGTSPENVRELAEGMGLQADIPVPEEWAERGYITIIRANWHLLPYSQLLTLLDWPEERLVFTLKEDDFLFVKLGQFKPDAKPIAYRELTVPEKRRTAEIRTETERMRQQFEKFSSERPFAFLRGLQQAEYPATDVMRDKDAEEICLDNQWSVVYGPTAADRLLQFAGRFIDKLHNCFGIQLKTAGDSASGKVIELSVNRNDKDPAESHSLSITEDRISIVGCDETGIWRGLQHLLRLMLEQGAPRLRKGDVNRITRYDLRLDYSHFAVYGDPLLEPELDPYPDELLEKLSDLGINGIWLQGILYQLVPWEQAPERSVHWEIRLENLRQLVKRAAVYGIGVYLYLNEPRAMPLSFFDLYPDWKGHELDGLACLCTSNPAVQQYLRKSCARLFLEVPELAGVFTITMSENLTNCYSRSYPNAPTNCPLCAKRSINEITAEVNRLIAEGIHSVNADAKVICWTWGYTDYRGWTPEIMRRTIEDFPAKASVMSTSEFELDTCIGGVAGKLTDYSVSQVGPSTKAKLFWELADSRALKTVAKVQLNNSWECAAIPYLPVIPLIERHLRNLDKTSVTGLMLSWTVGGYPSITMEYASHYYWQETGRLSMDSRAFAAMKFGAEAGEFIANAWDQFSRAFQELPLSNSFLYTGPQNFGPANLFYMEPTDYKATMLGYPYDDLKRWCGIYPDEIFSAQLKKLVDGWKEGLEQLKRAQPFVESRAANPFREMQRMAESAYHHFSSTRHQTEFIRLRERRSLVEAGALRNELTDAMCSILVEEQKLAEAHIRLLREDSKIGFEASNHYLYTLQDLMEKRLNCQFLFKELNDSRSI